MDAQFLVGFDEPEVAEASRMCKAHTRSELFPARIVSQILVRPVLVRKNWIGTITRQRIVEIVFKRSIEPELSLINQLQHRVSKHRFGEGRAVHNGVRGEWISLGVTDAVRVDVTDLTVIDNRNGHALGVGVRHDLADYGVD